ncbi:carboxylesterase family protein [Bifidobacterium longum]|uniref:carboxylesterase family protein n=1 Tax=Bifidobacterium longum TaxID=216816 RepID=UPI00324B423E
MVGNNLDESGAVPFDCVPAMRERQKSEQWRPGRPPTHLTLEAFTRAARLKYRDMAEEFLSLYQAANDDEAAKADSQAVRDNARISTYLWGTEWTSHCGNPVRTYFWTHRAPTPNGERRAFHGAEITYAFDNLEMLDRPWNDEDRRIASMISSYWANYIASGNPNGEGLPEWPEYHAGDSSVMDLGTSFRPEPVAAEEVIDFWKRFFATQKAW